MVAAREGLGRGRRWWHGIMAQRKEWGWRQHGMACGRAGRGGSVACGTALSAGRCKSGCPASRGIIARRYSVPTCQFTLPRPSSPRCTCTPRPAAPDVQSQGLHISGHAHEAQLVQNQEEGRHQARHPGDDDCTARMGRRDGSRSAWLQPTGGTAWHVATQTRQQTRAPI